MDFSSPEQAFSVLLFIAAWMAYLGWCLSSSPGARPETAKCLGHDYRCYLRSIRNQDSGTSVHIGRDLRSLLSSTPRPAKPSVHCRCRVSGANGQLSCADRHGQIGFRVVAPMMHLSHVPVFKPVRHH